MFTKFNTLLIMSYTFFFISNPVAKGEGLVLVKKLSNSLSNLKGYIYKIQKNFIK